MRSLNSLRNVVIAITYELMLVAFSLIVPRLIIGTYGSEVNGLASTVNNVLQILSLLQAGAAGASIFQMYKPVAENDYEKISVIMDSTRKFFCRVGAVFLILVFAISPVFGFAVKGDQVSFWEKVLAFIILGINGSAYMFFTSYFDVLFSSHQKRFILSLAAIANKLVYYGLVIVIVLLKLPFMLLYVAAVLGTAADVLLLYIIYSKEYKPLIKKVNDNGFKIPNRGYLLVNQVAIQAITSLPVILTSLIGGLSVASVFSVYFIVYTMVKMVLNTMELSVSAVFGNLTVSKGEDDEKRVFNLLEFTFSLIGTFLCVCSAFLYVPFIYVYTNSNTLDVNYIYPAVAYGLVALAVFFCATQPYLTLTNSHGYYKETYLQAAICAIIGAGLSVGLSYIDWTLVVSGPVFFYMSTYIYRMAVAKKNIKWVSVKNSVRRLCFIIIVSAAAFAASYFFYRNGYPNGWLEWVLQAVLTAVAAAFIIGIYIAVFERKEFMVGIRYVKAILFRKNGRKSK